MFRMILLILALLATLCPQGACAERPDAAPATTGADGASTDPARLLSASARRLLASITTSSYAHQTAIDEASGTYVTDCSGLLTWLLRRDLPKHLAAIPIRHGRSRPLAADFQEAFAAGAAGWQRIDQVRDVHPGDVIAWRYANPQPGKSTGHVVIVDGEAIPTGERVLSLVVIDATTGPHDDDTRSGTDGVGRGTIHLRVDGRGALEAVQQNGKAGFKTYLFAIARPVAP